MAFNGSKSRLDLMMKKTGANASWKAHHKHKQVCWHESKCFFCAYGSWFCCLGIFPEPSLQVTEFVGKPLQTRLVYDIETTLQADNDIDPFNASHFSFTSCSSHNFMNVPFTSSQPSTNIFPHSKKDIFVQRWCCTACKRGRSMVLHTTSPATSATSEFTSPASKYDTGLD